MPQIPEGRVVEKQPEPVHVVEEPTQEPEVIVEEPTSEPDPVPEIVEPEPEIILGGTVTITCDDGTEIECSSGTADCFDGSEVLCPQPAPVVVDDGPKDMPGVVIKMLREGTGEKINRGDKVFVFYRGTFASNRQVFDSNLSAKDPLAFTAGSYDVIQALSEGSIGLTVGSTFVMIVPPEFGFGEAGVPGFIPPKSTLIFEIVIVGRNELKYKD